MAGYPDTCGWRALGRCVALVDVPEPTLRQAVLRLTETDLDDYWDLVEAIDELTESAVRVGLISAEEGRRIGD